MLRSKLQSLYLKNNKAWISSLIDIPSPSTANAKNPLEMVPSHKRHLEMNIDGKLFEYGRSEKGMWLAASEVNGTLRGCRVLHLKSKEHLDRSHIENTLQALQRRHPLLRSRVKENGFQVCPVQNAPRIPLEILPRNANEMAWQTVWNDREHIPLQVNDLAISVVVLQDKDAAADFEVVVLTDHLIFDGRSLSALLHEFLCLLTNEPPPSDKPLPMPMTIEALLEKHYGGSKFRQYFDMLTYMGNAAAKEVFGKIKGDTGVAKIPPPSNGTGVHVPVRDRPQTYRTYAESIQLSEEDTTTFLAQCRANSTSVTAAVTAALMSASVGVANIFKDEEIDSQTRKYLPSRCYLAADPRESLSNGKIPHDHLAYHVGGMMLPPILSPDSRQVSADELWEVAHQCRKAMLDEKKSIAASCTLSSVNLAKIYKDRREEEKPPLFSVFITSFGVSPIQPTYGAYQISGMTVINRSFSYVCHRTPLVVIHTTANRLSIDIRLMTPEVSKEVTKVLRNQTKLCLDSLLRNR